MKGHSTFECSIHAEIDLLSKLGEKAKGSKFYVYRFNNTSNPEARDVKNAKPCLMCQHVLKKAGVSRIYYIDDQGDVKSIKNKDLVSLIAEPANITKHFLEKYYNKYGTINGNQFSIQQYVKKEC